MENKDNLRSPRSKGAQVSRQLGPQELFNISDSETLEKSDNITDKNNQGKSLKDFDSIIPVDLIGMTAMDKSDNYVEKTAAFMSDNQIADKNTSNTLTPEKSTDGKSCAGILSHGDLELLDEGIPRIVDGLETPDSEAHISHHEFFMESDEFDESILDSGDDLIQFLQEQDLLDERSFTPPDQAHGVSNEYVATDNQELTDNPNNDIEGRLTIRDLFGEIDDINCFDSSVENIVWNVEALDKAEVEKEVSVNKLIESINAVDNDIDASNVDSSGLNTNIVASYAVALNDNFDEDEIDLSTIDADTVDVNLEYLTTIDTATLNQIIDVDSIDHDTNEVEKINKGTCKIDTRMKIINKGAVRIADSYESAITKKALANKRKKSKVTPPYTPQIKEDFDNSCAICDKTFKRKDKVMRHMTIHIPDIPDNCDQCDRSLCEGDVFLLRIITMDVFFSCQKCEAFFCGNYQPLDAKMEAVHKFHEIDISSYKKLKGVPRTCHEFATHRFSCDVCDENFILEQSLAFHVLKMHNNTQDSTRNSVNRTTFTQNPAAVKEITKVNPLLESLKCKPRNARTNRIFTCNFCQRQYRRKIYLTRHLKTCTEPVILGEYPSDLCDIIFGRKSELSLHKKKDHRHMFSR